MIISLKLTQIFKNREKHYVVSLSDLLFKNRITFEAYYIFFREFNFM